MVTFGLTHITIFIVTVILRKTHKVHIHHYTACLMGLPLIGYPHGYLVFISGWTNGVYIEGVARWGFDPVWIPIKNTKTKKI